ncbi:MAG TPA: tripartite tricarboxylate transporter TctB family protein [Methylomirabilota bacterium]|nr:tripartite tricarboxylate transporter TctB family protein [Methylomirabilota bacterium]
MASRDRRLALGLAALALLYLAAARRYPPGTPAEPGPGVFPIAAGAALFLVAAWLFAVSSSAGAARPDERRWSAPVLGVAAALVGYAALLPLAGFAATSFALVAVTAWHMGLPGWWRPLALGAGVVMAARGLFVWWLGVPLP